MAADRFRNLFFEITEILALSRNPSTGGIIPGGHKPAFGGLNLKGDLIHTFKGTSYAANLSAIAPKTVEHMVIHNPHDSLGIGPDRESFVLLSALTPACI